MKTVAIGGLGAIGLELARALDRGVEGFRLIAVASRDTEKARAAVAGFRAPPRVVPVEALAEAEIVIEAAPAAAFAAIARPAIAAGRVLLACSGGALMRQMELVEEAEASGARIIVPTGALVGLDAVRAAAYGRVDSVVIETRKPPRGLAGAPYLERNGISLDGLAEAKLVFQGNALEAAEGFPANVNVAAALAMAGIGPQRTEVRLWADPAAERNIHTIRVEAEAARFSMTIEGMPSPDNPRTGRMTPLSVLACLRGLTETLKIGS
ncbi:aspartate dehydrogenase [Pseudoroseomonas globiformis]|uniref:L-aspartate dehydrogenase n=1 Tax=Teichococcus globiformis TaxID=2307229 RepID=A0ABV7FU18_9PROT